MIGEITTIIGTQKKAPTSLVSNGFVAQQKSQPLVLTCTCDLKS